MSLDDLDIKILVAFWNMNPHGNTWELAKRLFPKDSNNMRKLDARNNLIKLRISKMGKFLSDDPQEESEDTCEGDLFIITRNEETGRREYRMLLPNIKMVEKYPFPNGLKRRAMCLRIDGKWNIFELESAPNNKFGDSL